MWVIGIHSLSVIPFTRSTLFSTVVTTPPSSIDITQKYSRAHVWRSWVSRRMLRNIFHHKKILLTKIVYTGKERRRETFFLRELKNSRILCCAMFTWQKGKSTSFCTRKHMIFLWLWGKRKMENWKMNINKKKKSKQSLNVKFETRGIVKKWNKQKVDKLYFSYKRKYWKAGRKFENLPRKKSQQPSREKVLWAWKIFLVFPSLYKRNEEFSHFINSKWVCENEINSTLVALFNSFQQKLTLLTSSFTLKVYEILGFASASQQRESECSQRLLLINKKAGWKIESFKAYASFQNRHDVTWILI